MVELAITVFIFIFLTVVVWTGFLLVLGVVAWIASLFMPNKKWDNSDNTFKGGE